MILEPASASASASEASASASRLRVRVKAFFGKKIRERLNRWRNEVRAPKMKVHHLNKQLPVEDILTALASTKEALRSTGDEGKYRPTG